MTFFTTRNITYSVYNKTTTELVCYTQWLEKSTQSGAQPPLLIVVTSCPDTMQNLGSECRTYTKFRQFSLTEHTTVHL